MEDHSPQSLRAAKRLRKEMSLPEVLLWNHLRGRPMGVKFRKQHPVGDYILDFYCAAKRIGIEIDGIAHDMGNRALQDSRRDAWLRREEIEVLRVPAVDVLRDVGACAESLVRYCADSPPPTRLRRATSPRGGGL